MSYDLCCHIHAWVKGRAQIANMYIENLNTYGDAKHRVFAHCLGVPSTSTPVVSAFSFSLYICQ